jgi:hypothetical protein
MPFSFNQGVEVIEKMDFVGCIWQQAAIADRSPRIDTSIIGYSIAVHTTDDSKASLRHRFAGDGEPGAGKVHACFFNHPTYSNHRAWRSPKMRDLACPKHLYHPMNDGLWCVDRSILRGWYWHASKFA